MPIISYFFGILFACIMMTIPRLMFMQNTKAMKPSLKSMQAQSSKGIYHAGQPILFGNGVWKIKMNLGITGCSPSSLNRLNKYPEPTMNKLIQVIPQSDFRLRLVFSDHSWGELDFNPSLQRTGSLLEALHDPVYFARCFIEMGAVCWPNGLELGAESLRLKLLKNNALHESGQEAA